MKTLIALLCILASCSMPTAPEAEAPSKAAHAECVRLEARDAADGKPVAYVLKPCK